MCALWAREIEYERYTEKISNERSAMRVASVLTNFIETFPEARKPEDILATDVADWYAKVLREAKSPATAAYKLKVVRAFFNWLRRETGWLHPNPCQGLKGVRRGPQPVYSLTLADLKKLATHISQNGYHQDYLTLLRSLTGSTPRSIADELGLTPQWLSQRWRRLLRHLELQHIPLKHLHKAYQRLCMRLGNIAVTQYLPTLDPSKPLVLKTKPPSNLGSYIKRAPANVGTPVIHDDQNHLLGPRVDEQESRAECQGT